MQFRRFLAYIVVLYIGLFAGRLFVGSPSSPETKQLAPITANTSVTVPVEAVQSADSLLEVHFIDVGQGDSIFIQAADGSTALIDGGNPNGLALAYLRAASFGI